MLAGVNMRDDFFELRIYLYPEVLLSQVDMPLSWLWQVNGNTIIVTLSPPEETSLYYKVQMQLVPTSCITSSQ